MIDDYDRTLAGILEAEVSRLGLRVQATDSLNGNIALRRSRRLPSPREALATVSLVRADDMLQWTYRRSPRALGARRSRHQAGPPIAADVIYSYQVPEAAPNRLTELLENLDTKFTPSCGLKRLMDDDLLETIDAPPQSGSILLLIHGTFSKSDAMVAELTSSEAGRDFLALARKRYKHVLAFDHPTLAVSPILNCLDLDRLLPSSLGPIDVVCHSRGGLVTAWWLRLSNPHVLRVVFAGSPLTGTNLASPERLKLALDLLANVANGVVRTAIAGSYFVPTIAPILGIAAGLMQVVGGALSLGSKTSFIDAGMLTVAGLAAQARVSNNQELIRLHNAPLRTKPTCYAITSDFVPNVNEPWWNFLKRLRSEAAAPILHTIFDGPNDLVVDVNSMTTVAGIEIAPERVRHFAGNCLVHHCNYFAQTETADFLREVLLS